MCSDHNRRPSRLRIISSWILSSVCMSTGSLSSLSSSFAYVPGLSSFAGVGKGGGFNGEHMLDAPSL